MICRLRFTVENVVRSTKPFIGSRQKCVKNIKCRNRERGYVQTDTTSFSPLFTIWINNCVAMNNGKLAKKAFLWYSNLIITTTFVLFKAPLTPWLKLFILNPNLEILENKLWSTGFLVSRHTMVSTHFLRTRIYLTRTSWRSAPLVLVPVPPNNSHSS